MNDSSSCSELKGPFHALNLQKVKCDDVDHELQELFREYEKRSDPLKIVVDIANLYKQRYRLTSEIADLDSAVKWLLYASQLSKGIDGTILRRLKVVQREFLDRRIKELSVWFSEPTAVRNPTEMGEEP